MASIGWERRRAAMRRFTAQFWRSVPGRIGLIVLLVFVLMAIAAPLLADKAGLDPVASRAAGNPQWGSPSEFRPMGTDHLRRSVWAQFVWGSRVSLFVGLAATVVTVALGSLVGIVAGFVGGRTDAILMRITELFLVIPFLPLAIVLASVMGRSVWNIIFVIGITSWPSTARLVRAQVLTVRQRLFVDRSRSLGASGGHVVFRHILPNVSGLILANATLAVPICILTETTLSFLGLGDPRQASWGKALVDAFENSAITLNAWWYFVPPGVGILLVVLAFTLIGQTLEQIADRATGWTAMSELSEPGPILSVDDLHVRYRISSGSVPAVRGVSFELGRGGSLGLAGESGCGKSTVANAILRLLPASTIVEGKVVLNGEDVLSMRPGRLRSVRWTQGAIVFQGALHTLNPVQRISKQIAEPMLLHRTQPSTAAAESRVRQLLEQVGLPGERASSYPHQLSGGQRQRVLIAMALACDPELLIADEPTTALDVMVQAQVLALLHSLRVDRGLSMIFITHDLSVLADVCDELAVMYAGRIVERGASDGVFSAAQHPYTQALAAAFPTIGDQRSRMNPTGLGGDPPDPTQLPPGCAFQPRCPIAEERCAYAIPELRHAGPGRRAACIKVGAD